jgi:uncharacterized membrane protein YgdD (TMEM256/DUF423 family)
VYPRFAVAGATSGLIAVAAGARYQMYHALALLAAAVLAADPANRPALWAGRLFILGTVLFSGSLYALALSGLGRLGMITPLGGVAFLAGWLALIVAARQS